MAETGAQVDRLTVVGLGLLPVPLLTVWHEAGGHGVACLAQGSDPTMLGAFYARCAGLGGAAWWLWRCAR